MLAPVGLPDHVKQHIATMARLHREGRYDRATDDVEQITGQPAQTVEQYVAVESRSVLLTAWIAKSFDRLFDMTGRTVIVTGGTRGIGLALGGGFVLAGARVVVASRKPDACEQAAEHLRGLGGQAIGVPTHLGDVDDLGALVQRTVDEFGGIDVVVNNAANALAQPLGEMTVEALTKSYEVNLRGPVFLVQEALPHLKASQHAAVLNMVSVGRVQLRADAVDLLVGARPR